MSPVENEPILVILIFLYFPAEFFEFWWPLHQTSLSFASVHMKKSYPDSQKILVHNSLEKL